MSLRSFPGDEANEVLPGLFIGSKAAAKNKDALTTNSITHVLTTTGEPPAFPDDFEYLVSLAVLPLFSAMITSRLQLRNLHKIRGDGSMVLLAFRHDRYCQAQTYQSRCCRARALVKRHAAHAAATDLSFPHSAQTYVTFQCATRHHQVINLADGGGPIAADLPKCLDFVAAARAGGK
jgi:hypothetical protein